MTPTGKVQSYQPNCFHQTLLELRCQETETLKADLFSQACIEQFQDRPQTHYGYLFAQVFEPYVLQEIAEFEGQELKRIEDLSYGQGASLTVLRGFLDAKMEMSPVEAVNAAAALLSISRFKLATELLDAAKSKPLTQRDAFEIAMLEFVIANRLNDAIGMVAGLRDMQRCIQSGQIALERQADAASQAIVWHLKSKILTDEEFDWYLDLGQKLSQDRRLESGALSSWYRAVAMVPAAQGDKEGTRTLMKAAKTAADQAVKARPNAYEQHFIKTYHESSLKEHMYVSRDYMAAQQEGAALIALDKAWSVSYAEVAEMHRHFGAFDAAAEYFETAAGFGPPYFGVHLFSAAQCHEKAGNGQAALSHYAYLAEAVPDNLSNIVSGAKLATKLKHPLRDLFDQRLEKVRAKLSPSHFEFLEA